MNYFCVKNEVVYQYITKEERKKLAKKYVNKSVRIFNGKKKPDEALKWAGISSVTLLEGKKEEPIQTKDRNVFEKIVEKFKNKYKNCHILEFTLVNNKKVWMVIRDFKFDKNDDEEVKIKKTKFEKITEETIYIENLIFNIEQDEYYYYCFPIFSQTDMLINLSQVVSIQPFDEWEYDFKTI